MSFLLSSSPDSVRQLFAQRLGEGDGMSQRQFEKHTSTDHRQLEAALEGEMGKVPYLTALKLSTFLKQTPTILDRTFLRQNPAAAREIDQVRKLNLLLDYIPFRSLAKEGAFDKSATIEEMEHAVCRYLDLPSLYDYENLVPQPAFSSVLRTPAANARGYFVRASYRHLCGLQNPNPFNLQHLNDVFPKIKGCSLDTVNGLATAIRALYHAGVTVSYQPSLPGIAVRGATFALPSFARQTTHNQSNLAPGIILTDTGKRYATLWFALIHELHHVLKHWDLIAKDTYHLSDDQDLRLTEQEADAAARDYWCPPAELAIAKKYITDQTIVLRVAKRLGVHPAIVYHVALHERAQTDKWAYARRAPDLFTPPLTDALQVFESSWSAPSATTNVPHLLHAIHRVR